MFQTRSISPRSTTSRGLKPSNASRSACRASGGFVRPDDLSELRLKPLGLPGRRRRVLSGLAAQENSWFQENIRVYFL